MYRKFRDYSVIVLLFIIIMTGIILTANYKDSCVEACDIESVVPAFTITEEPTTEETTATVIADYRPELYKLIESSVVEIKQSTVCETTVEETTEQIIEETYTYYYIYEANRTITIDRDLQEYAQDLIISLGMEDYIQYWYAQCFQESSFRMEQSKKAHGGYYDWGIMQIWEGLEHDKWSGLYNVIKQYSNYKTDPYDNVTCGIYLFNKWYKAYDGDIINALGTYYSGVYNNPDQKYINDVCSHLQNLKIEGE